MVFLVANKRTCYVQSQEFTEHVEFQREMNALLQIRAHGGHPNICMLRENFDDQDDYLLVLDLVMGKEMFDHLIEHGAYSEADASRLVRQVASALDFIHGIGVVHADLKVCYIL
jgi:serine/threonine protein kinase